MKLYSLVILLTMFQYCLLNHCPYESFNYDYLKIQTNCEEVKEYYCKSIEFSCCCIKRNNSYEISKKLLDSFTTTTYKLPQFEIINQNKANVYGISSLNLESSLILLNTLNDSNHSFKPFKCEEMCKCLQWKEEFLKKSDVDSINFLNTIQDLEAKQDIEELKFFYIYLYASSMGYNKGVNYLMRTNYFEFSPDKEQVINKASLELKMISYLKTMTNQNNYYGNELYRSTLLPQGFKVNDYFKNLSFLSTSKNRRNTFLYFNKNKNLENNYTMILKLGNHKNSFPGVDLSNYEYRVIMKDFIDFRKGRGKPIQKNDEVLLAPNLIWKITKIDKIDEKLNQGYVTVELVDGVNAGQHGLFPMK